MTVLASALVSTDCSKQEDDVVESVTWSEGDLAVTFRFDQGTYDVSRGGVLVFRNATADVLIDRGPEGTLISFRDGCARRPREGRTLVCDHQGIELRLTFELASAGRFVTAKLEAINRLSTDVTILRLAPLVIDGEHGGALLLGNDPKTHRILENGRFIGFDQTVQLEAGDVPRFGLGNAAPIPLRGNSVANWNHVVSDLTVPQRSLVAGYLTFERSIPTLGIGYSGTSTHGDGSGRIPFDTYAAESALIFHGKKLAPGAGVASELLYLDPLPKDPVAALENYADAIAVHQKITPWPKRGPGHEVPIGWNSWTGGSFTAGHGQAIDQALILSSMGTAKRELAPFGMNYFQVDDGWQVETGDWQFKPSTFPDGGAALVKAINEAGFRSGLWIAPFWVKPASSLAKTHPEWLATREDSIFGAAAKDGEMLDLSNPAARAHVRSTLADLKSQGWQWIKADFTYQALVARAEADPSLTNVEAFRAGWKEIREAIGPDTFLVGIGITASNIGIVDSMRLTLDDGPKWEEPTPDDVINSSRSLKATVRTGSRRWFYGNRVFVNHNDLIYFRDWPAGENVPPLGLEEARTFASWVALGGGIVKIGDKFEDLAGHPERIDVLRRLMPVWPDGARPLDVLTRDYPEQFRQTIRAPSGQWDVVGLFNWGRNRDWTTNPPTDMPEATRHYAVPCLPPGTEATAGGSATECLAYEFWSEAFLGAKSGTFEVEVASRRNAIISLRPKSGAPQLIGTNRHVTQGATDLVKETWDSSTTTLSGALMGCVGTAVAPWEYHLAFYAPGGRTVDRVEVDGLVAPLVEQNGELVKVKFSLAPDQQGKTVGYRLKFK